MKKRSTQYAKWKWDGYYIYLLCNTAGEVYIGITTDVDRRFNEHVRDKRLGGDIHIVSTQFLW